MLLAEDTEPPVRACPLLALSGHRPVHYKYRSSTQTDMLFTVRVSDQNPKFLTSAASVGPASMAPIALRAAIITSGTLPTPSQMRGPAAQVVAVICAPA